MSSTAPRRPRGPRRRIAVLGVTAAFLLTLIPALPVAAKPDGSDLVISQVYGAGGNAVGVAYLNDYVEIFNPTASSISLTGRTIQYASATGTGNFAANAVTALSGSLAAGKYYLVQLASGGANGSPLPTPDATGTVNISGTTGKVALVNSATGLACNGGSTPCSSAQLALITDLLGYGGANFFEGAVGPAPSNTNADFRANGGCTDTDNNAADFTAAAAAPRNSASPAHGCVDDPPTVVSSTPAHLASNVPVDQTLSVTFSEAVDVTGDWFDISCVSGFSTAGSADNVTWTIDPIADMPAGVSCTLTIVAANVTDKDGTATLMAADYTATFTTASGLPSPGDVVISEVYGGGGNSGATFTNDFIELYNRTANPIDLTGWSVQYASAAGTVWQVTALTGSIPAGKNYLVQEAAGAGGTTPLPVPDASGSIPMSATSGKVVLVSNTTPFIVTCPTAATVIDLVGYGATACFEGTAAAPSLTNSTSDQRKGGGAQDTNDNAADFTAGAPDPHAVEKAPAVRSTIPADAATGVALASSISITFTEPVDVTGAWFTISCGTSGGHAATVTGGPTTFSLDPGSDFAANESCTVTVLAANVTDQDADDPPDPMTANYVFSFSTVDDFGCGTATKLIHEVQGTGASTPIPGSTVRIQGIVVGDYQTPTVEFGGFYLEEETGDWDGDPTSSEGIFVFDNNFGVAVNPGDQVIVRGTVTEFNGLTEINSVSGVVVCSTGNSVTPVAVSLPVTSLDVHEQTEGMLVSYTQTLTAAEVFNLGRFGEVSLSGVGRLYNGTAVAAPGAPALAVIDQNNRSRIVLDDGRNDQNIDPTRYPQGGLSASNTLRVGDTLPGLTGVMTFGFGVYRIQPVGPISFSHDNARTPAPAAVGGNLKVASFNVLNFFNGDGTGGGFPTARGANTQFELDRQKAKEVSALTAMNADIVGLMEIENDAGPNSAIAELVSALNAAAGPGTYAYIDTGVIGTDEIKVALIYKPASVSPIGTWKIITTATDPRFIDTKNRPSLAQTFETGAGARLTVVVQHLKSKGSDCNDVGDPDTGNGAGNCNTTRLNAAKAIVDWLATDPTGSGDPDYLLIGDFNSYTFEDPIQWFVDHGYTNLIRQFNGLAAYSYVFNGESGYLDHGLASNSLAAQATGAVDWHINPDEPTVLDYNVEFKTANQINTFYDPGPYRSSDHDPVIIGLNLPSPNAAPSVDANGPYDVDEGGSVSVSATGSDPDAGDTLTYAWDLDDNGSFETPGQTVSFSAATIDGPATRTINVQVSDGSDVDVDSATVNIANVAPSATFFAPTSVTVGQLFAIDLLSPNDPSPDDTTAGFEYSFDCGDGFGYRAFATQSGIGCAIFAVGTYTVGGKIRDDDGSVREYTALVDVDYAFGGFKKPIKAFPAVNDQKAGDHVHLKFSLGGNQGLNIFQAGFPASQQYTCGTTPPATPTSPVQPPVHQGLKYDTHTGEYMFDFVTNKAWKGTCRVFFLGLKDGSTHDIAFRFK